MSRHDPEVVGDQEHREVPLAPQPIEQLEDLHRDRCVERGRRLVGQQHLRPPRQRDRDAGALAQSARKSVRVLLERPHGVRQRHLGQEVQGPAAGGRARHRFVEADGLDDLRSDRQDRIEGGRRLLEHHGDLAAPNGAPVAIRQGRDLAPGETHPSAHARAVGREPEDGPHELGLSAAALAHHRQRPPRRERERHAVHRGIQEAVGGKLDAQLLHREERRRSCREGRGERHHGLRTSDVFSQGFFRTASSSFTRRTTSR